MPTTRQDLHNLIDSLPDGELFAASRYLEFLSKERLGDTFRAELLRSREEAARGETTSCSSVEEMAAKLLGEPSR